MSNVFKAPIIMGYHRLKGGRRFLTLQSAPDYRAISTKSRSNQHQIAQQSAPNYHSNQYQNVKKWHIIAFCVKIFWRCRYYCLYLQRELRRIPKTFDRVGRNKKKDIGL